MVRPSRNVDAALLAAGRELYPATGMRGLSVRKVAEKAGVNLGMFHYHFRTKDAFLRALLSGVYEAMFAELAPVAAQDAQPAEALRAALGILGRFARDHRLLLRRLLADALNDEPVALAVGAANLPRHVGVVMALVLAGQRRGVFRAVSPPQALAFIAGAIGAPILLGTAVAEHASPALRDAFEQGVLTDRALAERIDLVLAGLAAPAAGRRR